MNNPGRILMDRAVHEVAISSKPTQRNKKNSHGKTLQHNKKPDLKKKGNMQLLITRYLYPGRASV